MHTPNRLRYQPVDNGYEIIGSRELFNRTLYGSHANDDSAERYFTFSGDLPLFMGAATDWSRHTACHYAKSGVLMSGLALTPGAKTPHFYSGDIDISSRWFHGAEDIVAVFRNGWMEYELRQLSAWFPDVKVSLSAFPLIPEDGFLVHLLSRRIRLPCPESKGAPRILVRVVSEWGSAFGGSSLKRAVLPLRSRTALSLPK